MGALWPDIPAPVAPQFTPQEAFDLAQFSKDHKEAVEKIVAHNNAMAASITAYRKAMVAHNRDVAKLAGMEQSKIDLIYPKDQ